MRMKTCVIAEKKQAKYWPSSMAESICQSIHSHIIAELQRNEHKPPSQSMKFNLGEKLWNHDYSYTHSGSNTLKIIQYQ